MSGGISPTGTYPSLPPSPSSDDELDSCETSEDEEIDRSGPINRFHADLIFQMGKYLTLSAKAAHMDPISFAIQKAQGQPCTPAPTFPEDFNYASEVEHAMSNFNRLFSHGTTLKEQVGGNLAALDRTQTDHRFAINAPAELVQANLAISNMLEETILSTIATTPAYAPYCNTLQTVDFQDIDGITFKKIKEALAKCRLINDKEQLIEAALMNKAALLALEKEIRNPATAVKIVDVLHCIAFRSQREMIRLRLTKSTFLDPSLLSQMSRGKLTVEEAQLLLTCISLKANAKKPVPICNPSTSEYHPQLNGLLLAGNSPKLCFDDPSAIEKSLKLPPKLDWDNAIREVDTLERGTKAIAGLAFEQLGPIMHLLNPRSVATVKQAILKGAADHTHLRKLFFDKLELEQVFRESSSDPAIAQCFSAIGAFLLPKLKIADDLVKLLPNRKTIMDECLSIEAETRLKRAIAAKAKLEQKFNECKHILRPFLMLSSQNFEIDQVHPFNIFWKMDNIEVREEILLEKSCAVMRRLHFPQVEKGDRTDLPYFADEPNDSVDKRWKALCRHLDCSDSELAARLLEFYTKGSANVPEEAKKFLVPLMILLMGKEPFLDSSSLAANFILLLSVKLGIRSFASALRTMPMIPQGAASAKQFLLHISPHALDTLSGVQYKKSETILRSYFLPTLLGFVGTADDWTQKYDDVASVAVECCQKLFVGDIDESDPRLIEFKSDLEQLIGRKLEIWQIPSALEYSEEEEASGIDFQKAKLANSFLIAMNQQDDIETAIMRCQEYFARGVDQTNPSIQQLMLLLERLYESKIPYTHLAQTIEYDGFDDDSDQIGKWAIDYLLNFHPLK